MPDRDPDVRMAIEHSIKVLSRWTIALYLVIAVVLGLGVVSSRATVNQQREDTARIDAALCAFTKDLERRIDTTRDYLDKHESAEPIPGITRADLRRSIQNQRMTLDSLEGLDCP